MRVLAWHLTLLGGHFFHPPRIPVRECCSIQRKVNVSVHLDARALVKLQSDHVNRILVPAFYRFLQAQDAEIQITAGKELHQAIETLVGLLERAEREILGGGGTSGDGERQALSKGLGLWVEGGDLGWTDVMVAPCRLLSCL